MQLLYFTVYMNKHLSFIKENVRFTLAIAANCVALCASIWWLIDSNLDPNTDVEIEPIVTCIALTATLLGLNFVNDKLSKPHLKVSMTMAITQHPIKGLIHGINIRIENHSIIKAFINNFQVELPKQNKLVHFFI